MFRSARSRRNIRTWSFEMMTGVVGVPTTGMGNSLDDDGGGVGAELAGLEELDDVGEAGLDEDGILPAAVCVSCRHAYGRAQPLGVVVALEVDADLGALDRGAASSHVAQMVG